MEIAYYILSAIMLGTGAVWVSGIRSIIRMFRLTPRLAEAPAGRELSPRISVILPARNEEKFIGRCLQSLSGQDYPDYEIVAVNDSSEDATGDIIKRHAKNDSRIIPVDARPKPEGWAGKNWACMEGYGHATGELLMFTDADTVFDPSVMSRAADHLASGKMDVLTAMPRLTVSDFWTRATLPIVGTLLHSRYSALRVNDPEQKMGYFFGSFFVIPRGIYEDVGMHKGVRDELIEDMALGTKTKNAGYRLRMMLANDMIDAVWARDGRNLWDALKRLMVPLALHSKLYAAGIPTALLFLLFVPFPVAAFSLLAGVTPVLQATSLATSCIIFAGAAIESSLMLRSRLADFVLCPVGGALVGAGFAAGAIRANGPDSVSWRGRKYTPRRTGSMKV